MSISTFDLDSTAAGTGATVSFTEQTEVFLFPNATLTTSGGSPGRVDSITVTLSGATATESMSVAAATLTSLGMTGSYNSATGVLTLSKSNGTDADWVTALKAVTYNNSSDTPSSSSRSITVVATDTSGPTTSTTNATINVTAVNDAPVNTVPGAQSAIEDSSKVIAGLAISDPDAGSATVTTTLSVLNGTITVATVGGGASVSGSGTGTVTLTGTVAQINATLAALNSVTYQGNANFNGADTLTMTTNDGGNSGSGGAKSDTDTVSISVSAVNDAPVNTVPGAQSATEDTAKAITGLAVSDIDAGSGTITTTLSVLHGTITVATVGGGASVSGSGTDTVTLTGTVAQINATLAALNAVTYVGNANFNGSDTLTMTTNDGGNSGSGGALSDTDTVAISVSAVNDAPVNTVPGAQSATEDTAKVITGLAVADVDAGGSSLTTTLSVMNGTIAILTVGGGAAVSGSGTDTVTLTGTLTEINTTLSALNAVTYQGSLNFNGSDTLTIVTNDGGNSGSGGAKSDTDLVSISVSAVNDAPTGSVTISGTATQGETLSASNTLADDDGLGTITYQWVRDGNAIDGATGSDYILQEADVGAAITVVASYTDGDGTSEAVSSSATDAVENVNDSPTGSVTITGTATQGETLTASNTLADEDGLGTISYQWLRDGTPIDGATASDYTLTATDIGSQISVVASYTDGHGTPESVSSAATDPVANANDSPTGDVTISGTAMQGETLSASNTLDDADGLGAISYQWMRDGTPIDGATGSDYTLTEADVGAAITVVASYTDDGGTPESVSSSATDPVANVNDLPTGDVTVSGTATQGETLTASNTLADDDGLGTISYQWVRDGNSIDGATGSQYILTEADVGAAISVVASYTDGHGTPESVSSDSTDAVENVNDSPTGSVTISGNAIEGETLTASNTLADADGLGTISYQWVRDGTSIDGATDSEYVLTESDVGAAITVVASYTDGHGTPESVSSDATDVVENVNQSPTGDVTISGDVVQGETLTASNTLADQDGLGSIAYQWLRDGTPIDGATDSEYVLTESDVGSAITVTASYTDGHGTPESVSSAATDPVENVNDAPTGSVTISGTPTQGETLSASNTLADADGLGTIGYQWQRDGNPIDGATATDYVLTEADVGAAISVVASYTDGHGTPESVSSDATDPVENVNDQPTGDVTISGYPVVGEMLTASNTLADGDGIGTISYQWLRDGTPIDGATGSGYLLTDDDLGAQISVAASYTDGHGTLESVSSGATDTVGDGLLITGTAGDDSLFGTVGNDVLDGLAGADQMTGGSGNDTYYVDDVGDLIFEQLNGGADLIYSSVSYKIGANVENLTLTGTDSIRGTGSNLDNVITGNSGDNVLDGRVGADTMIGAAGNDTYVVDNAGDVVVENADEGIDTVNSSLSHTLGANVENLVLTGTASINGTGNGLANVITGNSGNNVIDGGAGADRLIGGAGNDTYYVDNSADVVVEKAAGGIDLVYASSTYTLKLNIENLVLTGSTSIDGTGNESDNFILGNSTRNYLTGGAGADLLAGGLGNDVLKGGAGADAFLFDTTLGSANVDTIKDFVSGEDTIVLDQSIFSALSEGALSASAFHLGTKAQDTDDRILYDQATGRIFYDADGSGGGAKVLFAQLTAGTVLTSDDFSVVDHGDIPSPTDLSGVWHDHFFFV